VQTISRENLQNWEKVPAEDRRGATRRTCRGDFNLKSALQKKKKKKKKKKKSLIQGDVRQAKPTKGDWVGKDARGERRGLTGEAWAIAATWWHLQLEQESRDHLALPKQNG